MRNIFCITIFLLALAFMPINASAQDSLSNQELNDMEHAAFFMDHGMADDAIKIIDGVIAKHPTIWNLHYEKAYALYKKEDYKAVVKLLKQVEKMDGIAECVYSLEGSAIDMLGKPKDAIKKYQEGLKKFPKDASLAVEIGICLMRQNKFADALNTFETAIDWHPTYASPYYHSAEIMGFSTEPLWSLIYGEAYRLLDPNSDRSQEASKNLFNRVRDCFKLENDSSFHVTLTTNNSLVNGKLSFANTLEMCSFNSPVITEIIHNKKPITIAQVTVLRQDILKNYNELGASNFPELSLFKFQQEVIDAGHWEAYNMWLFNNGDSDEFSEWVKKNNDKLEDFFDWCKNHYFNPSAEHPTLRTKMEDVEVADK